VVALSVDIQSASSVRYPSVAYPSPATAALERIDVAGTPPAWWPAVQGSIEALDRLPWNWDPRGSRTVSRQDVRDAVLFLVAVMRDETRAPWIGPLPSGGIQLAWRRGEVEVEAVFDHARGERELLVSVGDQEWEAPIDQGAALFATIVEHLAVDAPAVA
jgi:hypothetical protein